MRTDVTFRFLNFDRPERYHEPRGFLADGRTMRREFRNQYRANEDYSVTANGYQRWNGGKLGAHNLVFGVEAVNQDWTGRYGRAREPQAGGPVPPIDLLAPVYGRTSGALYPISAFTSQAIQSRRTGLFLQDQIEIMPRLQLALGARVERFADEGAAPYALSYRTTGLTGRAGLVYRIAPFLTAFGNYANSFSRPPALAQSPLANGPFEPELGRQIEGGVKSQLANGRVLVTASVFRITKRNVLRPDPNLGPRGDNSSAVLPIGRVRNQGFEFDATGRLTTNLSVLVNYAFLDSVIVADRITPSAIGRPLPNAARHAFGLFARYDIRKTGTTLSIGNEARGRRYEPYAGIQAAGYGLWDFGIFQRLNKLVELRLQVDNGFDKTYALSSLFAARVGNMPGAPRTVIASLRFTTSPRTEASATK